MRENNRVEIMIDFGDNDKYILTFYLFETYSLTTQFITLVDKIQNVYVNYGSHIKPNEQNSRPIFTNINLAIDDLNNFIKKCHKSLNTYQQYHCEIYYQPIDDCFLKHVYEKEVFNLRKENTNLKNKLIIYQDTHL